MYFGRYPSGSLFNPIGNTDPNNIYSIVAGPATNGSEWVGTYVGWKKRSGVAKNQVFVHNNQNRIDCNHFTILPSGKFFMGGYAHLDNDTNYTQMNYTLFSGKLDVVNDTVIDLNTTIIAPPFFKHGTDTVGEANYSAAVAFNKAGTVGYYVFI